MNKYSKINDYSLIGDLLTCALISNKGSIDWYCLPHINSPSMFAGILDKEKGGHFKINPTGKFSSSQTYLNNTNILETKFQTVNGSLIITDFMPVKHVSKPYENTFPTLIRKVTCTRGQIELDIEFKPRFDYARAKTKLESQEKGIIAKNCGESGDRCKSASGNEPALNHAPAHPGEFALLKSPIPLSIENNTAKGRHKIKSKETLWFVLQYNDDRDLSEKHCENAFTTTNAFWNSWVNDSDVYQIETGLFKSPWKEIIIRSGLVLKLLIQDMTGAICAAATTSLPEHIGGERNWDYRFNWIRDAAFTVRALYKLGYVNEARKNLEWFMRICTETTHPKDIQIMYGLSGETDLNEQELSHLEGYRNSKPVRIGNGAAKQKQLDIYGELVNVFYETSRFGMDISDKEWELLTKIIEYVCENWNEPDAGIWEVRGGYQHFVHSKLMCWVAVNRGLKIADKQGKDCPRQKWLEVSEKIKNEILEKGFDKDLNSFVQAFGSKTLDATSLLIPIMKLLPFTDPRVQGTLNAILQNLTTKEGLVYRYKAEETNDGLKCDEGAFLLCSFWLIDVLAYSGRIDEAKNLLLKMIKYASPTGLLAEEIDPKTGEALGNYPQAYSHIGLINSALYIEKARKKGLKALSGLEMKQIGTKLENIIRETHAKRKAKRF